MLSWLSDVQAIQQHQESQTENVVEEEPVEAPEEQEQAEDQNWQGKWQDKEAWSRMQFLKVFSRKEMSRTYCLR